MVDEVIDRVPPGKADAILRPRLAGSSRIRVVDSTEAFEYVVLNEAGGPEAALKNMAKFAHLAKLRVDQIHILNSHLPSAEYGEHREATRRTKIHQISRSIS